MTKKFMGPDYLDINSELIRTETYFTERGPKKSEKKFYL